MCCVCFYWVLPAFNSAVLPDFNPILFFGLIPQLDYDSIGLGARLPLSGAAAGDRLQRIQPYRGKCPQLAIGVTLRTSQGIAKCID